MSKDKKLIIILLVLESIVVIFAIFMNHKEASVVNDEISGKVTKVIDRPNRAEDGYYEITVNADGGEEYTINATGYLNTPLPPDSLGEDCVDVPKVQVGDSVTFNLPKSKNQDTTFDICYKKSLSGYYFKID